MGMRAEEIAKTLIDIQCRIYERHGATGAPTSRDEYERWVCEATDMVTPLYGSADMGRHGLEMGRALQMATDMGAHIAAEAMERALAPEDGDAEDADDLVSAYDDVCDGITNLMDERAVISQAIAVEMRRLVGIAWDVLRERCEGDVDVSKVFDPSKPVGCMMPMQDRTLVIYGSPEFDVPSTEQFRHPGGTGAPPECRIGHVASMDGPRSFDRVVLRRRTGDAEETVAVCSSELIGQPGYVIRCLLAEPQGEGMPAT